MTHYVKRPATGAGRATFEGNTSTVGGEGSSARTSSEALCGASEGLRGGERG